MDELAIRRSAIVLAAMQPTARRGVLHGLDPQTRTQLETAMRHVTEQGWGTRAHALTVLASAADTVSGVAEDDVPRAFVLASQLDSKSFARVLQASGIRHDDFLLSMLEPGLSRIVRAELAIAPPMSAAVSMATRAAAEQLIAKADDGDAHASA